VRYALRDTSSLLLGMGILMLGAGLQGTLLGVRATLEGFSPLLIGAVMAAYYVGYVAGSLVAPSLIHRVGHIRAFAALSSVTSVAILLQSIFLEPAAWAVLRAASGVCFAGIFVVAESWLNDRAKSGDRGALLSAYMVVLYLAMGAGQFLLNLADPQSETLFIVVAVLISTATVPLALTAQRAPDFTLPRRARVRELLNKSPLGVIGVFVAGALAATFVALGPAYAAILGLEAPAIATFMATGIFAATAAQLPLGRWSDRTDRRTVIMSVSAVAALAAIAAMLVESSSLSFMAIAGLCTGLSLTVYPLAAAHVNDHLDSSQLVAASSTLILINGAGAIIGPLTVAMAMQAAGARAYFGSFALLHAALGFYALWRKTRTSTVSPEHKEPFTVAAPQSSPTGRLTT
jgi:MFS family permease